MKQFTALISKKIIATLGITTIEKPKFWYYFLNFNSIDILYLNLFYDYVFFYGFLLFYFVTGPCFYLQMNFLENLKTISVEKCLLQRITFLHIIKFL